MDPNEAMDNEPIIDPIESESIPQSEPVPEAQAVEAQTSEAQAPAEPEPTPVFEPQESAGSYHAAGVGQKESPYANSPYYTAYQTQQTDGTGSAWNAGQTPPQDQQQYRPTYEPQSEPPKAPKVKKKRKGTGRKVVAALLAIVLVAGSCGITAALVNNHWEKELDNLEQDMNHQIAGLQQQMTTIGGAASVSGSPVSADGLTPSQVYAMNVNSVVAITNEATVYSGWGMGTQTAVSSGSGFIISQDGYVVTNHHVVEDAESLTVTTCTGDEYEATLIGSDEINDVALLKVEATGLDAVAIGSSGDLIVGDQVVAIGNPLGELTSTQTVGYVSGKDRSVSTDGTIINMLQTDAAINSGNSGGPLFNMKGEVVGITTAKYSGSSSSGASIEGIGFAIPIDDVMGMIDDFKEFGAIQDQAYLGISGYDLESSSAQMYSLPLGFYVESVVEGSSADRAGVQPKDIVIALGDYTVESYAELTNALRKFKAGDTTTITVYHAGQELVLDITFDERPADLDSQSNQETLPGEMPDSGDYEEWYNYFAPYFGFGNGNGNRNGNGNGYGFGFGGY